MIQRIIFYISLCICLFWLLPSCLHENTKTEEKALMPLVKSYKRESAWLANTKDTFFSYNKYALQNSVLKKSEAGSLKKARQINAFWNTSVLRCMRRFLYLC